MRISSKVGISKKRQVRDGQTVEDLAAELYTIVGVALRQLGVSPAARRRALERARKATRIPRASGAVLRDVFRLGNLTLAWKTEPPYRDEAGHPRVLDLHGKTGSFEALAKRYFPRRPLASVVNLACRYADVTAMKSGRMALLGSTVVDTNADTSTPLPLAHLVRQVDALVMTSVHNHRAARGKGGRRRFERMCTMVIPRSQFDTLMQELRPQMHDLLERTESLLGQMTVREASRGDLCVANVGLYVSRCDELERAGHERMRVSGAAPRREPKGTAVRIGL
jgi:hypothetical protein